MSMKAMAVLAQNPELFAQFQSDPMGTIKIIEQMTGADLGNISVSDIELIKTFSPDELQVFFSVAERMKGMNKHNFKL